MSVYVYGALIVGGACVAAIAIALLVFRFGEPQRREANNDVNGLMFAIVGVLYAIVIGFVVTAQWQSVDTARDAATQEANGLVRLYWATNALPAHQRAEARRLCRQYALVVRNREWPAMAAGRPVGPRGRRLLTRLASVTRPPADASDTAGQELSGSVNDILDGRQQRLTVSTRSLSGMMWFVLVAGAVLTIGLAYLFGLPNRAAHLVMVGSLVGTTVLLLYASYQLQYPFGPAAHVEPIQMTAALQYFGTST